MLLMARAGPLIGDVAVLLGTQRGGGSRHGLQSPASLRGHFSWPLGDKQKQLLQTTWLHWNRFWTGTSFPFNTEPDRCIGAWLIYLCRIQRRDLSVGRDFNGSGWLGSSPGETAAIWIYSSTFALFWLFHFLAHSCELGRFFLKEAKRLVFQTGFLGDRFSNLT